MNGSYYHVVMLITNVTGNYSIRCESLLNTSGYLYAPSFDERSPLSDLIAFDDGQSSENSQFRLTQLIETNQQYYLVVAPYLPALLGTFDLLIRGQNSIELTSITGEHESNVPK